MSEVERECAESAVLRTLPLRVLPAEGEALTSWLETLARRYSAVFVDITATLGIARKLSATAWLRIADEQMDHMARVAGLPIGTVRAMTFHKYTDVLPGTYCTEHSGPFALWVRHQGARYCPDCLRESGGRWRSAWYLNWTFACLTHRCLLVDECPRCHRRQRARTPPLGHIPKIGTCCRTTFLATSTCEADLAEVVPLQLDVEDPVLAAQRAVDRLLRGADPGFEFYAGRPTQLRHVLADLRALTQWAYTSTTLADNAMYELECAMPAMNSQRVATGRPRSAKWGHAGVNPHSGDVAVGVALGLKVLSVEANRSAPQLLKKLMVADSALKAFRSPIMVHAGISAPLKQAIGSAFADVRRGRNVQRRLEHAGARAVRHFATSESSGGR